MRRRDPVVQRRHERHHGWRSAPTL
jgi:hypothetical protein